jgi:sucrose-6-phosphate hydrolase SacC (GH32 family)
MHLYLDHSSLELFADDGCISMTEIFFPSENFDRVSFFQTSGKVKIKESILFELDSVWQ